MAKKGNIESLLGAPLHVDPDAGDEESLIEGMLNGPAWETFNPTDSEWHTAAPTAPLVTPSVQETESAPATWDGPIKAPKITGFDEVFNAEELEAAQARAPVFHKMTGRFDPFELDRLRTMFDGAHYSTFLHRPIMTFRDALDHSIQLCRFWSEEDAATEASKQKEKPEWVPPPPTSNVKEERIEAARIEWKNAVAMRKEAIAQWDDYVAEMRLRYNYEKRGRQ